MTSHDRSQSRIHAQNASGRTPSGTVSGLWLAAHQIRESQLVDVPVWPARKKFAPVPHMKQPAASIMWLRRPSGSSDSSVSDNSGENGCCVLVAGAGSLPVMQDFVLKNWSLRRWGSTAPRTECSAGDFARVAPLQTATTTGRGSRWIPAIMQRTDPPASSMVGMSRGRSVHDRSMIASWSGRRLLAARRERARMRPPCS